MKMAQCSWREEGLEKNQMTQNPITTWKNMARGILSNLGKTDFCDLRMECRKQSHVYEHVIASGVMVLDQKIVGSSRHKSLGEEMSLGMCPCSGS